MWLRTTSSPSISTLNSVNTRLRATIEAPKCESATALIAKMWESAEYLSPNLPFRSAWKSYLLLLMILHMSMYLKHRTARLSFAALHEEMGTWGALELSRNKSRKFCSPGLGRREFQPLSRFLRWFQAGSRHCWRWLWKQSRKLLPLRSSSPYSLSCSTTGKAQLKAAYHRLYELPRGWARWSL